MTSMQSDASQPRNGTEVGLGRSIDESSCSIKDESWISLCSARRTLGRVGSEISDEELAGFLSHVYLIAGTVIDIAFDDIGLLLEEQLEVK